VLFFCELHLDSIDRDIEGELAKSPKMVSNVQQLMFIGENLLSLFIIFLRSDTAILTIKLYSSGRNDFDAGNIQIQI
jgi:hypothetical protein